MSHRCQFPEGFFDIDFQFAARHASSPRESVRLLGLAFLQQHRSVAEVSELLSVHPEAVHDWLKRFKVGGLDAMKERAGRGRKPLLPASKREEFKSATQNLQEEKSGGSIVGRDVKQMLSSKFNINCCLASCYNYLHQVNLSWISGRTKHPKQDLDEQEAFKKTSLKLYAKKSQQK